MKHRKKWLTLKSKKVIITVDGRGRVFDNEHGNQHLYILNKHGLQQIQDLINNYDLSNEPVSKADDGYVKFYDNGNKPTVFYNINLLQGVNKIMSKGSNRKNGSKGIEEDPVQPVSPIDPVPVIVEVPLVEKESKGFTYGSKEPTYIWSPNGLIRVN